MAEKLRVHTLSKELGVTSKVIVEKCVLEGVEGIANHMSTVSPGIAETIREWFHGDINNIAAERAPVDLSRVEASKAARTMPVLDHTTAPVSDCTRMPPSVPERVETRLLSEWIPDKNLVMHVEQAWLPMMVLEGVEVTVETSQGMTMMERFVIESLLRLERLQASELQEIASIPTDLATWLLTSLKQKQLVNEVDTHWFEPEFERCVNALEQGQLPVECSDRIDFLWFPETDEAVALDNGAHLLWCLRHLKPATRWPIPGGWQGVQRGSILNEILKGGRAYGAASRMILGVQDTETLKGDSIPAYVCRVAVPKESAEGWRLSIVGARRHKRAGAVPDNSGSGDRDTTEMELPVPPLFGVTTGWRNRVERLQPVLEERLRQDYGFASISGSISGFRADIAYPEAAAFSQEHILGDLMGLQVRVSDELECVLSLSLRPSDEGAQELFAVDKVVQRVLSGGADGAATSNVPLPRLYERLWQLRLFKPLYDLRETEDFTA